MDVRSIAVSLAAAGLALAASTGQAASIAVVAERYATRIGVDITIHRYELVLEPGEAVAALQLDLLLDPSTALPTILETGFAVPTTLPPDPRDPLRLSPVIWLADPWDLVSLTGYQAAFGVIRIANALEQRTGGRPAGIDRARLTRFDGTELSYLEFIDQDMGQAQPFRDPAFAPAPGRVPIARLAVEDGAIPLEWINGLCSGPEGPSCDLPGSGRVRDAVEPPASGLLALALSGAGLLRRRRRPGTTALSLPPCWASGPDPARLTAGATRGPPGLGPGRQPSVGTDG